MTPRRRRRGWRWPRRALPRSPSALALGGLLGLVVLVLLLLALTRARPGQDVPPFAPTTTTAFTGTVLAPSITGAPTTTGAARATTTTVGPRQR